MKNMTRCKSKFILVFLCFLLSADSYAYKNFEITTVSDIVKKVKKTFSEIETYQADFKIMSEKSGNKTLKNGIIRFKASNKMLIEFTNPAGQKIIADGKTMYIYIPSMNVVAEQDLKPDNNSLLASATTNGLNRLFLKYHYKFASKKQPEQQPDGSKQYTLFLKQKETRSGFRSIKLWISENFFITKAYGESTTGKNVEISFNNIKTNVVLPNNMFQFDVPAGVRISKNPMIAEE